MVAAFASLLTWNTYFSPYRWADRMAGILQTCAAAQPHVICLQEVLPQFLLQPGWNALLDRHGYVSSALDPGQLAPYGVLTLAKRELRPRFEEVALPTRMGRKLLVAHLHDVEGSGQRWRVGNVHLESLDSASLRREQLVIAGQALVPEGQDAEQNAVLCGDFNFDPDRNYDPRPGVPLENDALASALPGWEDAWPLLHGHGGGGGGGGGKKGYTFDATINTLLERPRPDEQMRYDRVMARMVRGSTWRPVGIELVGNTPEQDGLFLSDHFGLLASFASDEGEGDGVHT